MLKLFIALFGLILVYWIYKKKKQLFKRHPNIEPVITTIEAFEVQTFLHAETPLVCLNEDGQKFGQQFKQKVPPELPHTTGCRCQLVQIYYTSSDVFQGENQETHTKPSSLGDLKAEDARILKQLLIQSYQASNFESFEEMLSDFNTELISEEVRDGFLDLIKNAFQFHRDSDSS